MHIRIQTLSVLGRLAYSALRAGLCLIAPAAVVVVAALARADGLSDSTFGNNGVVNITFPTTVKDAGVQATALVNGYLEAAGFANNWNDNIGPFSSPPPLFIARISLTGTVSSAVGIDQSAIQNPTGLVIDSSGNIFAVGVNFDANGYAHATVVWFDSAGQIVASYMRPVASVTDQSDCSSSQKPLLDSRGRLVLGCTYGQPFFSPLHHADATSAAVLRLIPQNDALIPDSAFGNNGLKTLPPPMSLPNANGASVIEDIAAGTYYFTGSASALYFSASSAFVARLDATTGSLDTTYGIGGYRLVPSASPAALTLDSSRRVIFAGFNIAQSPGGGFHGDCTIARFNADGTPDMTFGTSGSLTLPWLSWVTDVLTDSNNRLYTLGGASQMYRFTERGTRDPTFSSSSDVQSINGFASAWASMQFSDSTHSSIYLVGGAGGCSDCTTSGL
jgi:hypothetical protein